jgi:hypothetical protein
VRLRFTAGGDDAAAVPRWALTVLATPRGERVQRRTRASGSWFLLLNVAAFTDGDALNCRFGRCAGCADVGNVGARRGAFGLYAGYRAARVALRLMGLGILLALQACMFAEPLVVCHWKFLLLLLPCDVRYVALF